jgi:type VI secretion system secreted protein VgrG
MGALTVTVGGACVNNASGNRGGSAKNKTSISVGGAMVISGGSKVQVHAKTITIKAGAAGNFLGGGGIMTLTPGSGSFVGMVTVDASGKLKIIGAPNLPG